MLLPVAALATVWLGMEASGAHEAIGRHGAVALSSAASWLGQPSAAAGPGHLRGGRSLRSSTMQQEEEAGGGNAGGGFMRILVQLIYGVIYYFLVANKYPKWEGEPTESARELMAENEVSAITKASCPNCLLSWCCTGPRAAHTFDAVGVMGYWPGLCLMTCFPCCTLFYANSCTELNPRLGGEKRSMIMSLLCTFCCTCCVVAQDATALDMNTSVHVGCCGVTQDGDNE